MAIKKRKNYTTSEKTIIRNIKEHRDHNCYFCRKEIIKREDLTVDHKDPYDGTNTTYENCVISCVACNGEKGCKNEKQYMDYLLYKNKISTLREDLIEKERKRVINLLRLGEQYEEGILLRHKAQATGVLLKSMVNHLKEIV